MLSGKADAAEEIVLPALDGVSGALAGSLKCLGCASQSHFVAMEEGQYSS